MSWLERKPRTEDPKRLEHFLDVLKSVDWQNEPATALGTTFDAINSLVHHEVQFYYRARKKQRRLSQWTRGLAVLLGSLGAILPLLSGANPGDFDHLAGYGYPLLVAAGACLAVNRLFGATGGHIRYVTAQLELERSMTMFRLEWARWQAACSQCVELSEEEIDQAFGIFSRFVSGAYEIIQEETNVWGKSVSEALNEYSTRIAGQGEQTPIQVASTQRVDAGKEAPGRA